MVEHAAEPPAQTSLPKAATARNTGFDRASCFLAILFLRTLFRATLIKRARIFGDLCLSWTVRFLRGVYVHPRLARVQGTLQGSL